MPQRAVLLGLDLGASKVVAVVAVQEEDGTLNVTGTGQASPQGGITQGQITDMELSTRAITRAVEEAMNTAGQTKVDGIRVAVDGVQFKGENLRDSITISSGDKIITAADRDRVLEQATNGCKLAKEELVLHRLPQMFHIKGQRDIRNPVAMFGETLEAEVRIVVAPSPVIMNINLALKNAGLHGAELMYSPLASAEAVLTREDRENGAVVVDIGEHLTHLGIFLHGSLFHSAVIPIGGMHFTRDLEITKHLGGITASERIKIRFGTVLPAHVPAEEAVELEEEGRLVSRREIAEVLQARASELLNLVLAEMGRTGLTHEIHGGVHLVGGGALLTHLPILAQTLLGRPRVVLGRIQGVKGLPQATGNPYFVNALGAVKALAREQSETRGKPDRRGGILDFFRKMS
ncbi:cell division protein FtsA [Geothrix rubra]|uniref:Cell division protein FtsA n=1 Tax=Geothrix rubra TaxID=2927977 RepID=A0ABQ5Q864_9BACT|nr:cell division protein FtsA [Geothrix rubra]GLH70611.1 cell division protein FtsA [Geothrix rubra]